MPIQLILNKNADGKKGVPVKIFTTDAKEAIRKFSLDDLKLQTAGIECRKDKGVMDEIPQAYKDIDTVMANQNDLVEIVHTLKQVMCIKG